MPAAVKKRPSELRVVGIERLADRDVYVATGRLDAITTQTMYFDIVTGLLRRDVIATETLLLGESLFSQRSSLRCAPAAPSVASRAGRRSTATDTGPSCRGR